MIVLEPYAAVAPPPTIVQSNKTTGQATPETFSFTTTPTDGNLLLLCLTSIGGQPLSIPPGFTQLFNIHQTQNSLLYGKIAQGESNVYQWTYAAAQKYAVLGVEVSGMDPTLWLNNGESNGGTGTAFASTPITPSVLNCLPLSFGANNATATISGVTAGWTLLQSTPVTNIAAFLHSGSTTTDIVTPQSIAWTWGASASWWTEISVLIAPVQPVQSGPPPPGPGGGAFGLGDHVAAPATPGTPAWEVRSVDSGVTSFYPSQSVPQDVPHDHRTMAAHTAFFTQQRRGGG
jgi:hypothetical protein